jgi:hypothetical protein
MPMVGNKKFGYDAKGKKEAKAYGKKMAMPVAIMVAVGKPKPLPKRGQRAMTNKMSRGK